LARQNIQDARKGFAVDLIVDPHATAVRQFDFDPPRTRRWNTGRHGR
jgi:hypothetical protein